MVKLIVAFHNFVNVPKKTSMSVSTSTIVLSPDPLPPTPSTSSIKRNPECTEEQQSILNLQMKGMSKWNTPAVNCTVQAVIKINTS